MSGGSSSPSPTTTTTGLAALPDWAQGYAKDAISNAASLTNINTNPYQQYDAQRIADFSPMQQQAQQGAANMQTSGAIGVGQDIAQAAGLSALGTGYNASNYGSQFNPQGIGYNAQNAQAASLGYAPQVSAGQYNAPTMGAAQTGYNPNLQNYQMGPAERVSTQSFAQPGAADAYMSPYMQNVVDIQKREAARQSGIQGTQQQAQAVGAGAFGGSRDAIQRAERERNLSQQMGDIQATGSQAAFQQAQQQFNAEQQARLAAQQANQQAGLTVGGQNLGAALGVQQLGAQTGLQTSLANLSNAQQANVQNQAAQLQTQGMNAQQAMQAALANQQAQTQYGLQQGQYNQQTNLANQAAQNQAGQFNAGQNLQAAGLGAQYGQAANQLNEQSRQYGAGLGLQGLQTGLQAAGQLGALGQNEYAQNMGINQLQGQYGAQQQAQQQQGLTQSYQDFLNQQNYPYKQMGFMSDMLRGLPLGQQSTQSIYQAPPSAIQNIGALGLGAYGAKQLGMFAEGGQVKSYADGGEINPMNDMDKMVDAVDNLTDEQLKQIVQRPSSAAQLQAAKLELATRASERSGLAGAYNMAQGGVVAFDVGGSVPGSYAPGNPALYNQALQNALSYNEALGKFEPSKGRTREEQAKDAAAYFKQAQEMGGPDPYADYEKTLQGFDDEDASMLSEGRGLAAIQGAAALLQGNDLARAAGNALGTAGASYGQTLKESKARKRASAEGKFQLASERRKERMGLGKEALAREAELAKALREGDKEKINLLEKQASVAAALAQATKPYRPTGGGGGGGGAKGYDALAQAIYDAQMDPKNPAKQARAQAFIKAANLYGKQPGEDRTNTALSGQELARAKDIQDAQAAAKKRLILDPTYNRSSPAEKKIREDEIDKQVVRNFTINQRSAAPGAQPAAGTVLRFDANGNPI